MPDADRLPRSFFDRPTLKVARELLGMRLVHCEPQGRTAGLVVETEAYIGEDDQACHARAGLTPRTAVMYGKPGHAYVYFNYGLHWLFNCVTGAEGFPAAVLIRALVPVEGLARIAERRTNRPQVEWMSGPARLCQALNLDGSHNGLDLCQPESPVFLEFGPPIPENSVTTAPRVGLNKVAEPWKSKLWNFQVVKERRSSIAG